MTTATRFVAQARATARAAVRRTDEHAADRGVRNRIRDAHPRASTPIRCGRHAEQRIRLLIHSATRSKSGLVRRTAHRVAGAQTVLELLHTPRVLIFLW